MTTNGDGSNEDFNDEGSKAEKGDGEPQVPNRQFGVSSEFLDQLRASSKAFEAFQKKSHLRNRAVSQAINDALKVDPQILQSFSAVAQQNEALTQWIKQLSEVQKIAFSEQFKGLENVFNNLKVWQEQARRFAFSLPNINAATLEKIRNAYPPNWSSLVNPQIADEVLYKDGIPIVWVPPSEILDRMLKEPDRKARIAVLIAEQELIIKDCERVINECVHVDLEGQRPLALAALKALEGHPETAQALAVNLTDSLIRSLPAQILPNKQYEEIKNTVKVNLESVIFVQMRIWYALAAIYVFFTTHYASSGMPLPTELSRHVSVHTVHIDHFNRENALVAIMLMTSIIRTLQDIS